MRETDDCEAQVAEDTEELKVEVVEEEQDLDQGALDLFVGARFSSYADLASAIESYSAREHVQLCRMETRTLVTAQRRALRAQLSRAPPELVYLSLIYACRLGGKKHQSISTGRRRPKPSLKQACAFMIHVGLTKDCQQLKINKMCSASDHNHPLSSRQPSPDLSPSTSSIDLRAELCDQPPTPPTVLPAPRLITHPQEILGATDVSTKNRACGANNMGSGKSGDFEKSRKSRSVGKSGGATRQGVQLSEEQEFFGEGAAKEGIAGGQGCGVGASSLHEGLLARTLHLFQRRALFCDTVLMTRGGGAVHAHSAVLAALCPRLLPALNHNPLARHQPNVVDLTRYDLALVTRLTDFFYTGTLGPAPGGEEAGGEEAGGEEAEIREVFELLGVTFDPIGPSQFGTEGLEENYDAELLTSLVEISPENQVTTESSLELLDDLPFQLKEELFLDASSGCLLDRGEMGNAELKSGNEIEAGLMSGATPAGMEAKPGRGRRRKAGVPKPPLLPTFECKFCPSVFLTTHQLNRHKWSHYWCSVSGVYRCKLCAREFKGCTTLRQHMRTTHAKLKPFVCAVCGHCFISAARLRSHINCHTDARPHQCEECGSCFNDAEYLTKHRRKHRGDKRFACAVCAKAFYTGHERRKHMRTHTGERPYQCSTCGARFSASNSLRWHMLTHTDERPFSCEQCPLRFRRTANLKLHVLNMHTDRSARPHHCTLCTRTYSTSTEFNNHLLTHSAGLTTRGRRRRRGAVRRAREVEEEAEVVEMVVETGMEYEVSISEVEESD